MSANEAAPAEPARRDPLRADAAASGASNAGSLAANGRVEGDQSPLEAQNAASQDSPPPPPPGTEDEETESEVEMEMDVEEDYATPPPPPPQETPAAATPQAAAIDEPDSEDEDEAFPPVLMTPRGTHELDEETKGGESDHEFEMQIVQRTAPVKRRVEVEERKQEGGDEDEDEDEEDEVDGDDEDDASYEEGPRRASTATGYRREKTRIEVEPDTELVRLAAAEADRMAAADKKMPVWNDWALQLSHRFHAGRAVAARLAWLQTVLRDPKHNEHGRLTDEMKRLMKAFNVATGSVKPPRASPKRRTIIGFKDPAKKRRKADSTGVMPSLEERMLARGIKSPDKKASPVASGSTLVLKPQEDRPLDAAAEEKLMRVAAKLAPEFVAAKDTMDVWNKIAAASHGRYDTGLRVRAHIRWLVKVFREPTHKEHGRLTPALRDLLAKFLKVTGQPLVAAGPTTPVRAGEKAASFDKVAEKKSANGGTPKKVKRVTIRPKNDEMLVTLVLEKRPFAASTAASTAIWSDIAAALVPPHPKITDGPSALARLNVIVKVFNDASHPNHNDFPRTLKEKLSSYNQIMTAFRANLNVLKRRVMHDDSSEASAEDVKILKPRALGEGADLAVAPKPVVDKLRRTSRSAAVTEPSKASDSGIELEVYRRKPPMPLNVEADELLLRVLLEKRPWTIDRAQQGLVWKEVAAAMQALNPRIWNGVSAMARVRSLQAIAETPTHIDHSRVTPTLRKMLEQFEEEYSKRNLTSTEVERPAKHAGLSDDDVPLQDLKKRKEPVASEVSEPVPPSPKRVRTEMKNDEKARGKPALIADEALLREALRARPFHSKRGEGLAAWDEVAVAVDKSLGEQAFRTGNRALSRMKRLLGAFRAPKQTVEIQLTERQREMADLVDKLLKVKNWPSLDTLLTDEHRRLLERIREVLGEEPYAETTSATVMKMRTASPPMTTELKANGKVGANDIRDDEFDEVLQPEMVIMPRSAKDLEQLRSQLEQANRQCAQLRVQLESKRELEVQAQLRRDQVNALQDEVIRLRSAAASDRASFETQLQSLQDEIASYRTQLASQASRLDQERRDHRDELRGIVAMLQSERAAHERDTATMLEVVHREREDRREEFVAMMNLVTRSVLQTDPRVVPTTTTQP